MSICYNYEYSSLSDIEDKMAEFHLAIRKEKIFQERKYYFELLNEIEFLKLFRLKKRIPFRNRKITATCLLLLVVSYYFATCFKSFI